MASVHGFSDEHDHRELRMIGDARDAVGRALKLHRFAEPRAVSAERRAQQLHRAIALRRKTAEAEILAQRVVRDERVERPPLPDDRFARGGENFGERGSFFFVERHALARLSKIGYTLRNLVKMKRKQIPAGSKLAVLLSAQEVADIREHTFLDPNLIIGGIVQDKGSLRFDWALDEIEEIQGYVAASANHSAEPKLERRLDRLFAKLQGFLDSFDDQGS